MVAFYSALSGEAGIAADQPRLQVANATLAADLASLGLQASAFSVLAPGSEYGPAKRWPTGHFAELARQLKGPVLLLGSAKEAELCDAIATEVNTETPDKCQNLAGKTALGLALSIIAATKLIVSNDSGLMHVAAALGRPTLGLFGPTQWWLYGPWGPRTLIAASNETRGEFAPIEALTVDRVFEAVLDLHDTWINDGVPLKP
jgi:heptosyltransferase-2